MLKTILNLEGVILLQREQQKAVKAGGCNVLGGCEERPCIEAGDCYTGHSNPRASWDCIDGLCSVS